MRADRIENVWLFKERQARNGKPTRSVEQLTALGDVSRAVSSTLDVEAVLDTMSGQLDGPRRTTRPQRPRSDRGRAE